MAVAMATFNDSARVVPTEKLGINNFLFTRFRMSSDMPLPSFSHHNKTMCSEVFSVNILAIEQRSIDRIILWKCVY